MKHGSGFEPARRLSVGERMFGLGTIGFATAGSDGFKTLRVMIDRPFKIHRIVVRTTQKHGK